MTRRLTPRRRWIAALLATLAGGGVVLLAQDLSPQVLRLLTRDNHWSGINTYDRTKGVALERGSVQPVVCTDTLTNLGGNLYFNCVLVTASAGVGTVTSVGLSLPAIFSVSGSPVTSSGTLTGTLATQSANLVFAGPTGGGAATPTFRALVTADLPQTSAGNITGIVPVANGGTGLSSGTSGGILGFTAAGTLASSVALTASTLVIGGGAGATPEPLTAGLGTSTTVLHGNAAGQPTWAAVSLTADVTGTLPVGSGGTGLTGGTSGGVPYFSGASTLASSALLTANAIVLGGGAGTAPTVVGSLGTSTTVLHGNASGAPTFAAVSLTADVSGTLPVTSGGTGFATATQGDLIYSSAANTFAKLAKDTNATRYLANTGTSNNPAWAQVNLANGVTGTLPAANGGTSITSTPTNGQLLIGNGAGYTLATLTGTADQITVTNGAGTITLSTPQAIATTSTPQFARLGLGTGAGAIAVITTTGIVDVGRFDNGNCGAADTITWTSGMVQYSTLTAASCTYTFQDPTAAGTWFTLEVIQDGTGGRLVTWPGTVVWDGGVAPTLSTAMNARDVCSFYWNGTSYYGRCLIGS